MSNNIAVITIPLAEWIGMKSQLEWIAKNILEIKAKDQKELLTPKEAMEVLKCSRNTLQSYIDKGLLEPIRMKSEKYSKVLIKRSDIDFLIQTRS